MKIDDFFIAIVLSLLVENKLGVGTFRLVGADKNKIHVGKHAEAAVSAEFTFELVAEIGCPVVEEFYFLPAG